jgi:type IV secretory pathway TrbF-like protein
MTLFSGCAPHEKSIPCDTPQCEQDRQWETRLSAAKRISSFVTRDEALSTLVIEASEQGNLKYALKALACFSSFVSHDKVADQAVTIFLNQDRPHAAKKIADTIESFVSRDRALVRVAKHPISSPNAEQ